MPQAKKVQSEPDTIDYTPGSDVASGAVVVQGSLVGVAPEPILSGKLGALDTEGVFDLVKATGAITAGAATYWDADGDPVDGTAGTGAATATSTGNKFFGYAVEAALSADAVVRVVRHGGAS